MINEIRDPAKLRREYKDFLRRRIKDEEFTEADLIATTAKFVRQKQEEYEWRLYLDSRWLMGV